MQGTPDNWLARGVLAVLCGIMIAVFVRPVPDASAGVDAPTKIAMPATDGGVIFAPPGHVSGPVPIGCGVNQKSLLIQNPYDADQNPNLVNVRVGNSHVSAWPASKKNGIILRPGESLPWDLLANGEAYVIAERAATPNDAGVAMGVICGWGGL